MGDNIHEQYTTISGVRVTISYDECACSPDEWGEDAGFIVACHRQCSVNSDRRGEVERMLEMKDGEFTVFPLSAYIHGGVHLILGSVARNWDTGQVGWVVVRNSEFPPEKREFAAKSLVDVWNIYLSGDVWTVDVENMATGEVESCSSVYTIEAAYGTAAELVAYVETPIQLMLEIEDPQVLWLCD